MTNSLNIRRNTSAAPAQAARYAYDAGQAPEEVYIRDAGVLLEACGITRSRSWVSRTVRNYVDGATTFSNKATPFGLYLLARVDLNARQRRSLAERADLRYLLTYADPTGEAAGRHVARERGEDW